MTLLKVIGGALAFLATLASFAIIIAIVFGVLGL